MKKHHRQAVARGMLWASSLCLLVMVVCLLCLLLMSEANHFFYGGLVFGLLAFLTFALAVLFDRKDK